MDEVVVVGGGGHARVLIAVLRKAGFRVQGYADVADRGPILGARWLGDDQEIGRVGPAKCRFALIGVGKVDASAVRLGLQEGLATLGFEFPVLCSPDAVVNEAVELGAGTVVFDRAVLNPGAALGAACIVNTGAIVEHDSVLGDNVHVATGAVVAGGVSIGNHCMIGAGSTVIQGIRIGAGCVVGAGATVVRDLTEPGIYAGTPANRIR